MKTQNTPGEIIVRHEDELRQIMIERGQITASLEQVEDHVSQLESRLEEIDRRSGEIDVIIKTAKAILDGIEQQEAGEDDGEKIAEEASPAY